LRNEWREQRCWNDGTEEEDMMGREGGREGGRGGKEIREGRE